MKVGGLFAGVGGLELGIGLAVPGAVSVWHSEIDPAAGRVLAHRYPAAVNHGDITAIDWHTVEPVDLLCGGWPCQPFSLAGKRKGADDSRALWPHVARAIRILRPGRLVLENVSAIVTAGELGRALTDLAALGYVGRWLCLRASDIGAPHRRERVFIVAQDTDLQPGDQRRPAAPGQTQGRRTRADPGRRDLDAPAHADRSALRQQPVTNTRRRGRAAESVRSNTDTVWGVYEPAIRRWEHVTGRPAPAPTTIGKRGGPVLSGRFTEWMMGYPAGWITDVPDVGNRDALRLCGNGVVPQQAAEALRFTPGK